MDNPHQFNIKQPKERKTLTKFEKAKLMSIIWEHTSRGFLKHNNDIKNPDDMYIKLKKTQKLPYIIKRTYPNGHIQKVNVNNT